MKHILFILLLALPGIIKAESFTYNKLILVQQGNDNFSIDKDSEVLTKGVINFDGGSSISIDGQHYELKPMKKENCFKCKGGMIRLVYSSGRLAYVQHYSRGRIYNYRIQFDAAPARGRNSA
jgi:hypothetical protein